MKTVNQQLQDAALAHGIDLSRYSQSVVFKIIAILNRSDRNLHAELLRVLASTTPSTFQMERLDGMLGSVRAINAEAYVTAGRALEGEMRALAEYEADYQLQTLIRVFPAQVSFSSVAVDQVYVAAMSRPFQGGLLREFLKDQEVGKSRLVRRAIASGFIEGRTTDQIVRAIIGTQKAKYADGLLEVTRRDAQAVVRTALAHMAGNVQDSIVAANLDVIKAVQWSSTLDNRTSEICFPSNVVALPVGNLNGVTRRFWEGEMFVVTTASGKKLRATPNHPVLTARGWRKMNELRPSHDILYRLLGDVATINPAENIGVPPTIGALADAIGKPSIGNVQRESTAKTDFHGDGMIGQHEIYRPFAERDLRLALNAVFGKEVTEKLLIFIAAPGQLPSLSDSKQFSEWHGIGTVAAQWQGQFVENSVQTAFADPADFANFRRGNAVLEQFDDLAFIRALVMSTPAQCRHDTSALQQSSDRSCGDAVNPFDRSGRVPFGIAPDNVVSVERELFSGHVYNLSTSTGFYVADGFVVHNCRIRDQLLYEPVTHKPQGHTIPWLSGPGKSHWNCRSAQVFVTKSLREMGIDLPELVTPGERASMDGAVAPDVDYRTWIKAQSAARQNEILGSRRGALLREGGLELKDLYSARGTPLTLEQLREKDAAAFKRAGL